ncbi:serine-type endopeptidase [Aureococcus anophagefferens]|nr:serine-type endopeptidase [Aureococcus anophagefferens]
MGKGGTTPDARAIYDADRPVDVSSNSWGWDECRSMGANPDERRLSSDDACPFVSDDAWSAQSAADLCATSCAGQDWTASAVSHACHAAIADHCEWYFESDEDACRRFDYLYASCDGVQINAWQSFRALERGAAEGRGGKGVIYVWATGNGYEHAGYYQQLEYMNNRFAITVGAVGRDLRKSSYSEGGPATFVVAPASDHDDVHGMIAAIPVVVGATGDCGDIGVGTSFACPLVAGVAALLLEANPQLGWRDVQGILASTSQRVDLASDDSWTTNLAGVSHSYKYGFGLVDALAALERNGVTSILTDMYDASTRYSDWKYLTLRHWGEAADLGPFTLRVADKRRGTTDGSSFPEWAYPGFVYGDDDGDQNGELVSWRIEVYGRKEGTDAPTSTFAPTSEDCTTPCAHDPDDSDYRGFVAEDRTGRPCQYWTSQQPNAHTYLDTDYGATDQDGDGCAAYQGNPSWCGLFDDDDFSSNDMCFACGGGNPYPNTGLGDHNFCRNPDGKSGGAWCFNADAPEGADGRPDRWDYCDRAAPPGVAGELDIGGMTLADAVDNSDVFAATVAAIAGADVDAGDVEVTIETIDGVIVVVFFVNAASASNADEIDEILARDLTPEAVAEEVVAQAEALDAADAFADVVVIGGGGDSGAVVGATTTTAGFAASGGDTGKKDPCKKKKLEKKKKKCLKFEKKGQTLCQWDETNKCHSKTCGSNAEKKPCKKAGGCEWKKGQCVASSGVSCKKQKKEKKCTKAGCAWNAKKEKCADCAKQKKSKKCKKAGCKWKKSEEQCLAKKQE